MHTKCYLDYFYDAISGNRSQRDTARTRLQQLLNKFMGLEDKVSNAMDQGRAAALLRVIAEIEGRFFAQGDERIARVLRDRYLKEVPSFETILRLLDANDKGLFEIEEEVTPKTLAILSALARGTKHIISRMPELAKLNFPRVFSIQGTTFAYVATWYSDIRYLQTFNWCNRTQTRSLISNDSRLANKLRELIRISNQLMFGEMPRLGDCCDKITLENVANFAAETLPFATAFAICGEFMPQEKTEEAKIKTLGLIDGFWRDDTGQATGT